MRVSVLLFLLIGLSGQTWAQGKRKLSIEERFRQEVGISIMLLQIESKDGVSPAFGAYYNPMLTVVEMGTDFSLAVDVPVTAAVHIENDWNPKTFFFGHIPVLAEFNYGHYSTHNFYQPIGLGVAAGYGGQYSDRGLGHGIVFSVAARSWLIKNSSFTIRYMFHWNMAGETGYNTHHIMVAGNLGRFFEKLQHANKISRFVNLGR